MGGDGVGNQPKVNRNRWFCVEINVFLQTNKQQLSCLLFPIFPQPNQTTGCPQNKSWRLLKSWLALLMEVLIAGVPLNVSFLLERSPDIAALTAFQKKPSIELKPCIAFQWGKTICHVFWK